jgi:putative ABC transport system permease protein
MLPHDLKFAWRELVHRPAFTAVAILILGLGIGANATIFSWVETVLLKPLPGVAEADRLVSLRGTSKSRSDLSFSYLNFVDLQSAKPDGLDGLIAFRGAAMSLRVAYEPMRVWGELVTPNFFDVLGVPMAMGRGFGTADGSAPGKEPVAVLSYNCWTRVMGSESGVLGRTITLNGRAFTVIGIAAEGFRGSVAGMALDVFVPITMYKEMMGSDRLPQRGSSFLQVFGRLAPGASIARAQASASVVASRLSKEYPQNNEGRGTIVIPLWKDGASGLLLPVMATLMAVVGVVLLIACANLAGLLLARAAGRQREVAVRLAIGASRGRLVRQFLVESVLLAVGGGAAGVLLAYWSAGMLSAFVPPTPIPVMFAARVSPTVLAFSVVVTFFTAIGFGLIPALRASRPDVAGTLKEGAGSVTAGAARGRLRQALVVSQVALSMLLLVCAALFVRSLSRAQLLDPGFAMRDGLLASIDVLPNGYDAPRGIIFFRQLVQRLSTVPQIQSVTIASTMPLNIGGGGSDMTVRVDGYQAREGEEVQAYYNRIAPRYFETMGIAIVRGRAIDDRDVEGQPLAVVVNETMAKRYWDGRDPIGSTVHFGSGPATVVGIARDGKYGTLNESPRNYMYVPVYQYFRSDMILQVRTAGSAAAVLPAVQTELRRLDPNLPLFDVRTMEEHLQLSMFIPKMASTLLGLFGVLALLLAVVGLYSVVAYNVAQRTHEIGVRMALGAGRGEIVRMVLRQGMMLTGIGLVIGLGLALGAAQVLRGQLMGLAAADPVSFGVTTAALLSVALAASVVPARRAASLDPVRAMRRD